MDASPAQPPPSMPESDDLEFKPAVKIAAAALLLLSWVCVCIVFYRLGYHSGYGEAVESGQVSRKVQDDALHNISYFLQVASADDRTLLDVVQNHEERLAWVKDASVKNEALCLLVHALLSRGVNEQVEAVLDQVMPPAAPESPAWAARMQQAARALAKNGNWEKARSYFMSAEAAYRKWGEPAKWAEAVRERAALLALDCGSESPAAELQALLEQQQEFAPDHSALHAELALLLARALREQGDDDALAKLAPELPKSLQQPDAQEPTLLVCYYAFHCEDDPAAAAQGLRLAVQRMSEELAPAVSQPLYMALGMRRLAMLALDREGGARDALAYLELAQKQVAEMLPQSSLFWLSLGEQQGWALFVLQDYIGSLDAFRSALKLTAGRDEKLRCRSLEGIARACLAIGQAEGALLAIEECVALREKFYPDAAEGLGRVYMLLGQANDQAGQGARAAEAYGRAAAVLPESHGGRAQALASQAQALVEGQQWASAVEVLEKLLPLVPESDADFREKVAEQLALCRRKAAPPAQTPPPSPTRDRRSGRSRGRRS